MSTLINANNILDNTIWKQICCITVITATDTKTFTKLKGKLLTIRLYNSTYQSCIDGFTISFFFNKF